MGMVCWRQALREEEKGAPEAGRVALAGAEREEEDGEAEARKRRDKVFLPVWFGFCFLFFCFPTLRATGMWVLCGNDYTRTHESGCVQLQGKAEAGTGGAFPGCARTRAYRSQTSPPVSKRTWVTSMCPASQVRSLRLLSVLG